MKFTASSSIAAVLLLTPARGPDARRDLTSEFVVPPVLEATLWAESPLFYKPTNAGLPDNIALSLTGQELVDLVEYHLNDPLGSKR